MNAAREPLPTADEWAARLDLRRSGGEWFGPCPSCGGTDRFHVRRGPAGALVGCRGCIDGQPADVRGKAFGAILQEVFPERTGEKRRANGNDFRAPASSRRTGSAPNSKPRDTTAYARKVWCESTALNGTLAETYLLARGVEHVAGAPSLRFSPALTHPQAPGRFPCLVAGVQDAHGGFLAVHRIYLDREGAGKANVEPARASLGSTAGGAVRLGEPEHGRLLVGEGIETTAAAMGLFDLPGWAAIGTGGLTAIELPEHVIDVVIAADRDAGGLQAAAALARRLEAEGRGVEIRLPRKGDFNDVLREIRQ